MKMEADSTTYDNNHKSLSDGPCLPFNTCPGNFKLFKELVTSNGEKSFESQIVERLQNFGLLPSQVKCLSNTPECKVICKAARVIDRIQWVCEACRKRQPIREGSFFFRLQCSITQVLQMVLAWCEDADCYIAAEHFGVKLKVATQIYGRLDELAIQENDKCKLGGDDSVVLAEIYPDCLNRLSPDTTDHPHVHRILMLADTRHIPTCYRLHVLRDDFNKTNLGLDSSLTLQAQVERFIASSLIPESTLMIGNTVPAVDGAVSIQQLNQHCDVGMQHFLSSRIWRQAITLCCASRDLCAGAAYPSVCARAAQRYLDTALYRLRYGDGFYQHMLNIIADGYTSNTS